MSGTSALLNLLEGSGSAPLNAPETAQNGVSEADSSYFVSLMKQYEGVEPNAEAAPAKDRDVASELLGNGLPIPLPMAITPLPVLSPLSLPADVSTDISLPIVSAPPVVPQPSVMLPAAVEVEADTRLEEFAVGLGIDRELARLLLRETGPSLQPALPLGSVPPPLMSAQASEPVVAAQAIQGPRLPFANALPDNAAIATSAAVTPMALTPGSEPRANEMPPAIVGAAQSALRDEDVLRWRALVHRSAPMTNELPQEVAVQTVIDDVMDPLSATPRRGLSEADFAAATASLRGFALERRQIVTTTATAVSSTILSGDSPVDPAVLPMSGGVPMNAPAAPSYALGSPLAAQPDPLTTPLRVPDPTLQHELRAEQFAEQVGRRMLQQIREDRWTVNLQLDPQRLGPMDIELQLEGNQVTAQVGVASAEVRHLLEAALPKLRESLDSAGLNLANWSFAQSGAREYRDFAQQTAAAARKAAPSGSDVVVEDGNSRRMSEESASRVVDVYV